MTFEELLMVIDPNADGGEILELEFRGNEEYNRVRSDCVEILEPLFEYQVNSIGINDNGEQRIWLDPPKRADTPQTDMPKCRNGRYYKFCEYEDNCNPTVCFKALDEFQDAVTDCDHKCIQTEVGCERTDCP